MEGDEENQLPASDSQVVEAKTRTEQTEIGSETTSRETEVPPTATTTMTARTDNKFTGADENAESLLPSRNESLGTSNWPMAVINNKANARPGTTTTPPQRPTSSSEDEALLDGFILLRLAQLLNIDVYYIGHQQRPLRRPGQHCSRKSANESRRQPVEENEWVSTAADKSSSRHAPPDMESVLDATGSTTREQDWRQLQIQEPPHRRNLMDELQEINPFRELLERHPRLGDLLRIVRIGLSLLATMISVDKTISSLLLCLLSRPDIKGRPGNIGLAYEASDITMSWLVLILLNSCSMYILFSTVFNGHLLWALLSQRLFLVSRRFQYKTMLSMLVFIYLEYIVNISFVNNLFGWSFESNGEPDSESQPGGSWHKLSVSQSSTSGGSSSSSKSVTRNGMMHGHGIHQSYSVLSNLETFVTEKDEANLLVDIGLTVFQFARGIIRMSPYITINYVTLCLNEHIKTIRNQTLLTESLKRKQKLRMVVKSKRVVDRASNSIGAVPLSSSNSELNGANQANGNGPIRSPVNARAKKRVIFATETSGKQQTLLQMGDNNSLRPPLSSPLSGASSSRTTSPTSLAGSQRSTSSLSCEQVGELPQAPRASQLSPAPNRLYSVESSDGSTISMNLRAAQKRRSDRHSYLDRIKDFEELESYVTNLYIFTGRLNRLMSRMGLAMFFIVHNLVITATLIVPEAIRGGSPMVQLIRVLVVLIGIVPFVAGQALDGQLEQLSKQIDRIIIQQQFISRKRDNLVRIRELLHDIRVNCGGMLNFNVATGIKYLVVAFASAFFIEQEGEFFLELKFCSVQVESSCPVVVVVVVVVVVCPDVAVEWPQDHSTRLA